MTTATLNNPVVRTTRGWTVGDRNSQNAPVYTTVDYGNGWVLELPDGVRTCAYTMLYNGEEVVVWSDGRPTFCRFWPAHS